MPRYIFGLHVAGLRHPQDSTNVNPILFTNGTLPSSGLPSPLSGMTVLPWIPIGGESIESNWTSDPRKPVGDAKPIAVQLLDDPDGSLGQLLLRDSHTTTWDLDQATVAAASSGDSTAILTTTKPGDAPVVGEVYYLEGEAVKVTASAGRSFGSGTSPISYTVTVTRGRCGSTARYHRPDPAAYAADTDGTEVRLWLDSRPNFDAYRFDATIYLIELDDFGAYSTHHARNVFVESQPKPVRKGVYEIQLSQISGYLDAHPFSVMDRTVTLSHCIRVAESATQGAHQLIETPAGGIGWHVGGALVPTQAVVYLTRQEAETLLREPLHKTANPKLDETLTDALCTKLTALPGVIDYFLEVEANGKWLFKIAGIQYYTQIPIGKTAKESFVKVSLTLVDRAPGSDLKDVHGEETRYSAQNPAGLVVETFSGAWSKASAKQVDTEGAKVTLRLQINATPVKAALYLLLSDGAASGGTYDKIPGRIGAGLLPAWLNTGAVQADPLDVEFGTSELLELNQILDEEFEYQIRLAGGEKLGAWLSNLCYLHTLLFGPLTDGTLTLRLWARPQEASLDTLQPIARPVPPGGRLSALRSLEVLSGYRPYDLQPEFTRAIRLRAPKAIKDKDEAQTIRIWKRGNHATKQDVESGPLAALVRSFLDLMGGTPTIYEVPIPIGEYFDLGLSFADFVYWNGGDDVPTADGFGFPDDTVFLVTGINLKIGQGEAIVRIVRDTYNESQVTTTDAGLIAPTLRPGAIVNLGGLQYQIDVTSLGEAAFDITTDHEGIWADYVNRGGLIHITIPTHAAAGTDHHIERDGYLEAYATVDQVDFTGGVSTLTVTFDAAWERDGNLIAADILLEDESFISLSDRRLADVNPQGDLIEPITEQLHNGGSGSNFIKVSGAQTLDRVRHLVSVS
jgi:hypothetical protein